MTQSSYSTSANPIQAAVAEPDWDIACERASRVAENGRRDDPLTCNGSGRAEWALWFSCGCNPGYVLYCTSCKDRVLGHEAGLHCTPCHQTFKPASTAYRLIEPLNRRWSS